MRALRAAVAAALATALQIFIAATYVTLRDGSFSRGSVLLGIAGPVLPLIAAWAGPRLVISPAHASIYGAGSGAALFVYSLAFIAVLISNEPLAPLLLVIAAVCTGVWFAGLILLLWIMKRWGRSSA